MATFRAGLFTVVFLPLVAFSLLAQNTSSTPLSQNQAQAPRARMGGCWQQAGIPSEVAQQGREIERNAHSQVMAVCGNSSLNPEQKSQQVRQLHEQAMERLRNLVTEQQADAYKACMASRGRAKMGLGSSTCRDTPPSSLESSPSSSGQVPADDQER
jgi:hypothetical protein